MSSCLQLIFLLLLLPLLLPSTLAATFEVVNSCPYTVWAAAIPGGGRQLNTGQSWIINVTSNTTGSRIWARTGCSFDGDGWGRCKTGDCGGKLVCNGHGEPPHTIAEYSLGLFNNLDFFDISLLNGFNVPMDFGPASGGCRGTRRCVADINGQCPEELRAPGGCNNPCTVFGTSQYCCQRNCKPTTYSEFFKDRCADAYSYPRDDQRSTFTCPVGTNYRVEFCPLERLRVRIQVIRL
ncbi:hypothetical protein Taro_054374 [Colocasia esculenta]|uniref:Uncharacterized protein n=1 Tax=Colocasia esculenta TaxID=4460 RepID=A0A843XQW9_COLES|nr:hypothetical protein [Colocasia esculenta]